MRSITSDPAASARASPPSVAFDIAGVVEAIARIVPGTAALHEPVLRDRERDILMECLASGWVSYASQFVERFERMLEEATGACHAVAMSSGTAALHLALIVSGIRPGDEVLVPALTFVATANAVAHAGAVPHFVDSDPATLGIDPALLDDYLERITVQKNGRCVNRHSGRHIAAVVPVHVFGHPADMDALNEIAARRNLVVVEDAAESLGSRYKGRSTATLGRAAILSFNGNKIVTTGGGGALLTDDEALALRARHLSTTAKLPHPWEFYHDAAAFNYRMPGLNAALGCAQLEQLPDFVAVKRRLAGRYAQSLEKVAGVSFWREPDYATSNYWLNAILLEPELACDLFHRDALLSALNAQGIKARPAWAPLHRLPMFANCPRMELPVAESLARRIVNLPSSVALGERA